MREVKPVDKPLFVHLDASDLAAMTEYPLTRHEDSESPISVMRKIDLGKKIGTFLAAEHALAVILPSRDGERGGSSGGTIFIDGDIAQTDWPTEVWKRENALPIPIAILAIENYGRVYRLLKANVPVRMEFDVDTKVTGDHEHGFNTIAEIRSTRYVKPVASGG